MDFSRHHLIFHKNVIINRYEYVEMFVYNISQIELLRTHIRVWYIYKAVKRWRENLLR